MLLLSPVGTQGTASSTMAAPPPRRRMGTSVKDLNGIGGGRPPAPAPSSGEAAMSASESARSLVQGQAEKFKR